MTARRDTAASATAVWLLDANVLIAMTHRPHVHHADAHAWFHALPRRRWASCAHTQLAFLRLSCHPRIAGETVTLSQARDALTTLAEHPTHEYWPDAPEPLTLSTLNSAALVGHRQVTDAYLLGLAMQRGQRLATLDRGLATYAQALSLDTHVELVGAPLSVQEPARQYAAPSSATKTRPRARPKPR